MAASEKHTREESVEADPASAAGDGGEAVVTACSYLAMQAELEREAAEVLSGKFDECTFDMGYVHQPLFACLTCTRPPAEYARTAHADGAAGPAGAGGTDEATEPAGMCYSCSIECHTGHDVVELFTKRHFRCDCGTRRLLPQTAAGSTTCCQLKKTRAALAESENHDNEYNHNFWGFYCRCDRFYNPSSESGLMVQCYMCNDWYHDACVGTMPAEDDYADYICRECVAKHAVVRYIRSAKATCGVVSDGRVVRLDGGVVVGDCAGAPPQQEPPPAEGAGPARKKARPDACRLRRDQEAVDAAQPFDLFMADGWREDICTCLDCMREISAGGLVFLIKEEAVVEPEEDETRSESLYESALKQLRAMDHVRAVDAASAYHSLSTDIKDYLRPFAASGKVVTGQDIRAFFEQHGARRGD
ncbi:hypothetical protein LPJ61_001407 [Coemansia biformis]|uniref:UBR-type domain-containing protein n=1 Tax=Coemansia biformis TaxID=1286918 RepID=A0A9W7YG20_9FUNG|nr:hypothetical protein LPJ61_001407 [Coemansia biformis]